MPDLDPCLLCDRPHDGPRYTAGLGEHDWTPGWEAPRKPLRKSDRKAIPHPAGGVTYPVDPHDPDGTRICGDRLFYGRNKA
jgi:hypothetical protein